MKKLRVVDEKERVTGREKLGVGRCELVLSFPGERERDRNILSAVPKGR